MRSLRAFSIISFTILLVAGGVSTALCQQSVETAAHIIPSTPGSDLVHAVATDCHLRFVIAAGLFLGCFGSHESPNASAIDRHPLLESS
jgi:hypothetical protein